MDAKSRAEELLRAMKDGASVKRKIDEENGEKKDENEESNEAIGVKEAKIIRTDEKDDFETLESLPRIQTHRVQTEGACIHEVVIPHDAEYRPLSHVQTTPAKEFPFVLDPFQREALLCLDNSESVLVAAHTSAGKTVVALYAIAMSLRDKQRVIYTSPIKALSNQKYRELYEEFQDVGLMTGDVTINPTASCLVMTTEILRSMLYRGSEVMREVGWVIFDEIHYMRDKERGVVWEEAIILLPDNVHYVFLSATIPNARQFAEWIVFLHNQPCHVVYTDYRPVPLQHYIYPAGGDGIHLVVNEKSEFKEDGFTNAMAVLKNIGDAGKGDKRGRRGGTVGDSNVFKLVKMCMENQMAPVIIFSFSRKECEALATSLQKLDFTDNNEKELIDKVFKNAMDVLSDEDRQLPQITALKQLLVRGIGIHHSGLLPILKETVEILFAEGFLKTLFATETFSMGLNMPAKTVLFSSARKFDGVDNRWISSGEYIQMSGRAGRRGLDKRGIVILMIDQHMGADVAKKIIKGDADPLNSQFRLTYNMVLNLLRVEGINPEFMLERSFYQFQNYSSLPGLYERVRTMEEKYQSIVVPNELETVGYYKIKQEITALGRDLQRLITKPIYIVPFLQPGRLIKVKHRDTDFGWGMVVSFEKKMDKEDPLKMEPYYIIQALLHLAKDASQLKHVSQIRPCRSGEKGVMEVVPIMLELVAEISSVRVFYPEDLRPLDNRMSVLKRIEEVLKKFPDGPPLLDPVEDMKIKEPHLKDIVKKIEMYQDRLMNHPLRKNPKLDEICKIYETKMETERELKVAKDELKKAKSLLQLEELKCRKRVLRRRGYANQQDVITLKGRVACEISAADELMLTEMLFNGMFNDLTSQQAVALLSCFTFQESAEMPKLAEELTGLLQQMQNLARDLAKVQMEAKVPDIEEDKYVDNFRPNMMDIVYAWANGATFGKILEKTSVFEGLQTEMSNVYIQEPPTSGKVCLKTTVGDIDVELWSKECPKACRNFIQLCMNEYYNETVFHRVVPGFIVQGGDPTGTGLGGESIYGEPFKDEFHSRLRFVRRGLVAMANSGPNDNGSQFFFTLDKAPELQGKHTIFGKVVGNTLFNMLKLGECEVDKNERPTYPHKIIKTEILNNPFPHIVPMKVESKKERTSEWRKDKSDVKVEKNFGLLSFGDEAEEEDGTNKAFSGKTRSTHDVEGVHGLSAEPAARKEELYQPEEEKNEEEKQKHLEEKERMKRRIAEKLKGAGEQMKNTAQKAIEEDEEDFDNLLFSERRKEQKAQVEALKAEYKQLQKEMVKKAKMDGKKDGVEEESSNKSTTGDDDADKNPLLAAVRAERRKYSAEGKDIPSRKSDERQKATLAMLERFKEKLETVKQKRVGDEEDTEKNVPTTTSTSSNIQSNISDYMDVEDDAPGDDWMAHRFEVREEQELLKQAKDANVKSVDSFDIYDPRNPMTKRRREKDRASEKKHGGSHGRHERVDESQSSKRSRYDR